MSAVDDPAPDGTAVVWFRRDLRVRELVAPHRGRITRDIVKAALFDDYQTP